VCLHPNIGEKYELQARRKREGVELTLFTRDGNDGPWSTFGMQVGSPGQDVRLLPATGEGTVLVIDPQGCPTDVVECGKERGVIFYNNQSSTWDSIGTYGLYLVEENMLGIYGTGLYGQDTVGLGWPGDNLPSLDQQVLASFATKVWFYLRTSSMANN
jgi:hypothetical protein